MLDLFLNCFWFYICLQPIFEELVICTHGAVETFFHQIGINIACIIKNIPFCTSL